MNIWCMSIAYCQHTETYWFLLNVTSAMKARGIHYFSLFLPIRAPSFSVPVLCTLVFFQGPWNEKNMRWSPWDVLFHLLHIFEATVTLFYWAIILLDWSALILSVSASGVCCHVPDDHTSCSQLFNRVWAEGQVLESMTLVHSSFL